ncbi:MAG: TlpA family protein disulfide reductase, partial [Rhizobium sp.]|nr:TlpA family protein disulfide reductase [Rhizobium sp.]
VPIFASSALAQLDRGPPMLRNSRYQFTLLRTTKKVHDVKLAGLDDHPTILTPQPGKLLLVNLWATWCEACRIELPSLERLHVATGDRLQVVAVPTDTADRGKVRSYLGKLSVYRLPVFLDPERRLVGNSADDPAPLTLYGMPLTYLIDATGDTTGYIQGATDWLSSDAQRLLAYYMAA